jgi:DNA primase
MEHLLSYAASTLLAYDLLPELETYSEWIPFLCPFHTDHQASCNMNENRFHCWSCDASGSIPEFVMRMENEKHREAIEQGKTRERNRLDGTIIMHRLHNTFADELKKHVRKAVKRNSERERQNSYAFFQSLNEPSWQHLEHDYMRVRGYDIPTLEHFKVRINNRSHHPYIVPIYENGTFQGLISRRASEKVTPKYLLSPGCNKESIIGTAQNLLKDDVLIVEGYSDMLAAYQYGWTNVLCLFGWYCSEQQAKSILKVATGIVSALDNDVSGKKGNERLYTLFSSKIPLYEFSFPHDKKDIQEMTRDQFRLSVWNIQKNKG